jgi:hypothetical protein
MNTYLAGQTVLLKSTFRNPGGQKANPSGAVLYVHRQGDTGNVLIATWPGSGWLNPTPGELQFPWAPAVAGTYFYEFHSTDALPVASRGSFMVNPRLGS